MSKAQVQVNGKYPVYSSESSNNGIIGYTNIPEFVCNKEIPIYITFGDHTRTFNIAQESFSVLDNVKVLVPSISNVKCLLFIITIWQKQIPNLGYSRHWKAAKNCILRLPQTSDGKIDFSLMERIVREMEELYIQDLERKGKRKLNAYLQVTGQTDCRLTDSDRAFLDNVNTLQWKEFPLGNLFTKAETKKLPYKAKELPKQPTGKNTLPCLTSSFMNQGLNYYVPRDKSTVLRNVISIPSNSDVYRAYYQPNDFTVLSDAYAIRWKDDKIKILPLQYLFMVACINRVTNLPCYSYKNKLGGWNVVKNKQITLPITVEGILDFDVMEQLMTIMQKIVIADIANHTSQSIDAARHIIES